MNMKLMTALLLLSVGMVSSIGNLRSLVGDGLPVFSVNTTNNASIVDDPKVTGNFSISSGGVISSAGFLGIELRGSSSLFFPKRSYGFETRDRENSDVDISLLGLPEEEDWILYGPYVDKSLMRNVFTYDLARIMGQYASRTRYVDLYVNEDYRGIYVLMEKLKRDSERIDISKGNSSEDVTGGYILKVGRENTLVENSSFVSEFGSNLDSNRSAVTYYLYEYPDYDDITSEQKAYISGYINEFETALASDDFSHPVSGNKYDTYIDVLSFIDFIILNEISKNVDGYRLSTYMHKDAGGKLKMGPIWDFNLGFGNVNYCLGNETHGWGFRFNTFCMDDVLQTAFWWTRLVEDPSFVAKVQDRWTQLRIHTLADETVFAMMDDYESEVAGSIDANFEKWDILGVNTGHNVFVGETHAEEVEFLQSWLSERMAWMDDAITSGAFDPDLTSTNGVYSNSGPFLLQGVQVSCMAIAFAVYMFHVGFM